MSEFEVKVLHLLARIAVAVESLDREGVEVWIPKYSGEGDSVPLNVRSSDGGF